MFIFYIICFWKVVKKSERWDYLIKKLERKSFFWMVMRKNLYWLWMLLQI